ncbi:Hypothetical protein CINCED_3A015534 [Cinara cedri]|uniref:Uncharacterized protein n=1 Tax=Cinara cedri TaxID=506608 RepID=A0A5E4N8F3_9HEMI|nr:Hypothetical protein CINCED_3A015534 [Cinara cedri]
MWPREIKLHENKNDAKKKTLEAGNDDVGVHESILGKMSTIRIRAGSSPEKPKNNQCCSNDRTDGTERSVQRNIRTCLAKQLGCCGEISANECRSCMPNESNACGGGSTPEKNSCETGTPEKKPCGTGSPENSPSGSGPREGNPCGSGPSEKNPYVTEPSDRKSRTSGLPEKGVFASRTKQQHPAVDPVDQIIEEGLQQRSNSRRSRRLEPNLNEPQQNKRHRQSKTVVPRPFGTLGYQPDFYDDAVDMQNWQENRNRQRHRTGDEEQRQRSRAVPDLGFVPYVDEDQPNGGSPASRRQDRVPVNNETLQIQQELLSVERQRLKLLKRVKRIHYALLAEVETYEQRPEEMQAQRQSRIENEKQKLSEIRRRVEARHQERQGTEQQQFDGQVTSPSSQYCGRNALAQRDPLTTPNRPAEADQQQRRKLYYRPPAANSGCTATLDESSDERLPVVRQAQAPKLRIPYRPPSQSDSSSSACEECNCQISPSAGVTNATRPDRRRRVASTGPANILRNNRQQQNHSDGRGGTRPRTMDAATSAAPGEVPLDTSGYYYNATRNGTPRLTTQSLNFICNCNDNRCRGRK